MTPEEIVNALNKAGHDGHTDWIFAEAANLFYSRSNATCTIKHFTPLSPMSALIVASYYLALAEEEELKKEIASVFERHPYVARGGLR